ncbi:MAG TPA: hypothetical protein VLH60_03195, partial [Sedimentisphaerales bacterium]|nr:hypothetical protein [Sedimentisphaerales bacterium]
IMFIILLALLAFWGTLLFMNPESSQSRRRNKKTDTDGYSWPKANLALLVITGLTVYMAIKSRRFIPIAAFVACPVMAMMLDQTIRMIAARARWIRERKTALPEVPKWVRPSVIAGGLAAVVFFGMWWGLKFKRIYLDPWPNDTKHTSVFMRMTASNVKPFEACDFIRMNNLSGNIFNYWTEGGFIAWGQEPDPETGRTPLQLFIDGRAQAAYNVGTYDMWGFIQSGGPAAMRLHFSGRQPTESDYREIGNWIDEQLAAHDVWVVLMPASEFNDPRKPFTVSLEMHPNWRPVYYDGRQKIFVRFTDPRGERLFMDVLSGTAKFPDDYSRALSTAYWLVRINDFEANREGLRRLQKIFEQNPTQEIISLATMCYRWEALREEIDQMCIDWLEKFKAERSAFRATHGYRVRLAAALAAVDHLRRHAADEDRRAELDALRADWLAEFRELVEQGKW